MDSRNRHSLKEGGIMSEEIRITLHNRKSVTMEDLLGAIKANNAAVPIEVGEDVMLVMTKSITIIAGDVNGA